MKRPNIHMHNQARAMRPWLSSAALAAFVFGLGTLAYVTQKDYYRHLDESTTKRAREDADAAQRAREAAAIKAAYETAAVKAAYEAAAVEAVLRETVAHGRRV